MTRLNVKFQFSNRIKQNNKQDKIVFEYYMYITFSNHLIHSGDYINLNSLPNATRNMPRLFFRKVFKYKTIMLYNAEK